MHKTAHIPLPQLALEADGTLVSCQFGDVYFSRAGGRAEADHVFLHGNDLPARWLKRNNFTIGELGFGSGLNFLVVWQRFLDTAPAPARLHYISFERYPLPVEMLREVHDDDPLAQALIASYPLRLPGFHRVHLDRAILTLGFGDARELLPQLQGTAVDAWFLDGFAPAKNPELWGEDVFREVGRVSAPDATAATYSVAGSVRRGLEAQGFAIKKLPGFALKREMLAGQRIGASVKKRKPERVVVAGGGIAGCTMAQALAERGVAVTLFEKNTLASGASGNDAAALYPQITAQWTPAAQWHFTAYGFALRRYAQWKAQGLSFGFDSPGMVKAAWRADELRRLQGVNDGLGLDASVAHWCEAGELSARTGIPLTAGGAWFPHGSFVAPARLCLSLVQHPLIERRAHEAMTSVSRDAAVTILCNAHEAAAFIPGLVFGMSAGQLSVLPAQAAPLRSIFCHKGYVIPHHDHYVIGATYDHHDFSGAVTDTNHQRNLDELQQALPGWLTDARIIGGRTSLRATTPDRLPYVGCVADGLYVSVGFGSRGMISAPLAAEIIASQLCHEAVPLTAALQAAVAPLRHVSASDSVRVKPSAAKIAS